MCPGRVYVTDGMATKETRDAQGISKDHHLDAYVIACNGTGAIPSRQTTKQYEIMQFRRHDRRACKQANVSRKYYLDGELVATNRHRAFEQKAKAISLDEYRAAGGRTDNLTVRKHKSTYQRLGRMMPGTTFLVDGLPKIMSTSKGLYQGRPRNFIFTDKMQRAFRDCRTLQLNQGLVFVSK